MAQSLGNMDKTAAAERTTFQEAEASRSGAPRRKPNVRRRWTAVLVLSLGLTAGARAQKVEPVAPEPSATSLAESFAQVAERVKPAVVSVTTQHIERVDQMPFEFFFGHPFEEFFREFGAPAPRGREGRMPERRVEGMGSGVIVSEDGYILTNDHVVRDADTIEVRVSETESYKGKVVGTDRRSDLAVVKIKPRGKLVYAAMGDSDAARVGDWVLAIGSPFGLEQTVTAGIVSAVRQSVPLAGQVFPDLIQTDASINRGNSGGPLVNMRGEVIGINTAIYAPTGVFAGVGFAIPSNRAQRIMKELIEKGKVVRGWMGVEIMPVDDVMAEQFGVPDSSGAVINRVMPDSPAEKAGLKRGDVVREFNGQKVSGPAELQDLVADARPKKKVPVTVIRDGQTKKLSFAPGEMPAAEAGEGSEAKDETEEEGASFWGARLAGVTPTLTERYGLPKDSSGVVILNVQPGGIADEAGLMEGDLVRSVNRKEVKSPRDLIETLRAADLKKGVVLDVHRRGRWLYLTYKEN